jgi:UPF0755 protein
MEPPDNFAPLKYESDQQKVSDAPIFSVPPDMKHDPSVSQAVASVPIPPAVAYFEKRFLLSVGIFFILAVLAMFVTAIWPPSDFQTGTTFYIEDNSSLGQITDNLYNEHLIKSEVLFKSLVIIFSGQRGIKAGDYLFNSRESVIQIAWRLVRGQEGFTPIKATIPEGFDVRQISIVLGKNIPTFSTSTFMAEALPFEGYLFPDTYFFNKNTSPDNAIKVMRSLFNQKISSVQDQILAFGRATSSVVVMASILEREATSSADRRIIAGILWKRLDDKMPLQVDSTLVYALNKQGSKLTSADLATTSPYNTYKNLGLPPTPIGNPGLSAIEDAINPTATDYWYYISDSKGNIHYAKTYDEQIANEAKYL